MIESLLPGRIRIACAFAIAWSFASAASPVTFTPYETSSEAHADFGRPAEAEFIEMLREFRNYAFFDPADRDVHYVAIGCLDHRCPAPRAALRAAARTGIVVLRSMPALDGMDMQEAMRRGMLDALEGPWANIVHVHRGRDDGDEFGAAVAFVSGTGAPTLLVGAPGWDNGRGKVYAYCTETHEERYSIEGRWPGERYGSVIISLGDVTGDAVGDFAVGAPGCSMRVPGGGRVDIVCGAEGAVHRIITGREEGLRLGELISGGVGFLDDIIELELPELGLHKEWTLDAYIPLPGDAEAPVWKTLTYSFERPLRSVDAVGGVVAPDIRASNDSLHVDRFARRRTNTISSVQISESVERVAVGRPGSARGAPPPPLRRGEPMRGDHVTVRDRDMRHPGRPGPDVPFFENAGERLAEEQIILAPAMREQFGTSVCVRGDINGDGVPDILVGAPAWDNNRGRVYAYCGATFELLMEVAGQEQGERFGSSVLALGDITFDGATEFVVGAPRNGVAGEAAGRVYVISGVAGSVLMTFTGDAPGVGFGVSVWGSFNPGGPLKPPPGFDLPVPPDMRTPARWTIIVDCETGGDSPVQHRFDGRAPIEAPRPMN